MVRGGKYFLDQTLVLGPPDGGTRDAPVVYTAYPGEKPVLSGGRKLGGWEPYRGSIFQCSVPEAKGGRWTFRRLWANGKVQVRARTPKLDPHDSTGGAWAHRGAGRADQPSSLPLSAGPLRAPLGKTLGSGGQHLFRRRVGQRNHPGQETLTRSGGSSRWCVPRGVSTAAPGFGQSPSSRTSASRSKTCWKSWTSRASGAWTARRGSSTFGRRAVRSRGWRWSAPVLERLIALHRTSFVTIRGLTFTETNGGDDLHPEGVEGLGAMFCVQGLKYCGETLHLNRAEWCWVEDNHFDAAGGNAVYLQGYNARNVIRRNDIGYAGANGIGLGGAWGYGDYSDAAGKVEPPISSSRCGTRTCNTPCITRSSKTTSTAAARSTTSRPACSPGSPKGT